MKEITAELRALFETAVLDTIWCGRRFIAFSRSSVRVLDKTVTSVSTQTWKEIAIIAAITTLVLI